MFNNMGLLCSLVFSLFISRISSIRDFHQDVDLSLRLPVYHAQGIPESMQTSKITPVSFSDALNRDDLRVEYLNSRLNKKNTATFHPIITSSIMTESGHLIDEKSVNVPLNPGESLGIANYYTRIGLGTPPTYHLVVMDTGSSFSWVQCEPCAVYCHSQVGAHFNPTASHTYQKQTCGTRQCSALTEATLNSPMCSTANTCIYTASYGDQSFSVGYLSKDSLSLGSESLPGFIFGCGQDNDGLFGQSAGLVGLAKNELSMLSQLSTKYGKAFAYCLPSATPLGKIGSGGFLSIGSPTNSAYKFTPMIANSRDPTLFFLKISAIYVSNTPIAVASTEYNVPTIIDSGTTISRLATPVYTALRDQLVKIISLKFKKAGAYSLLDSCFAGSLEQISTALPLVRFLFAGGAELNLSPHNVILEVVKGTTCLAFAGNTNMNIAILGNTQQQTFDIVYDVGSSRIGFAAGGCN